MRSVGPCRAFFSFYCHDLEQTCQRVCHSDPSPRPDDSFLHLSSTGSNAQLYPLYELQLVVLSSGSRRTLIRGADA